MNATTRWILFVVGLLVANALAMGFLVLASSTSRAEVIPDYYAKAAAYDTVIEQAERNRALGWRIDRVAVDGQLTFELRDAGGAPLDGARIRVTASSRANGRSEELELAPRGDGRYGAGHRFAGVEDLAITVDRGGERFTARVTVE